jgi:endonuclease-8
VSEVDAERAVELSRELLLRNATNPIRNTTGDARRRLWIYGRGRVGCLRCGGPVMAASLGEELRARVAFYCPACQPGPHP